MMAFMFVPFTYSRRNLHACMYNSKANAPVRFSCCSEAAMALSLPFPLF